MAYHKPVLLHEAVKGLSIKPAGTYVDVTFGGGGHSREILNQLGDNGKLFAFDQDTAAQQNIINDPRFTLIPENFRFLKRFLRFHKVVTVDGILADLGVSSHQFDVAERGFSTRFNAPLDMRMNVQQKKTAAEVLNNYSEEALRKIFKDYGELRMAAPMARELVSQRKTKPIITGADLKEVIQRFLPPHKENKILAQLYQAIRIEVNEELEVLKSFLEQTTEVLITGGRLSVISYHSLEDRLVKRFMRNGMFAGEPEKDVFGNVEVPLKPVSKFIVPSAQEILENTRARSAKLRIAEKLQSNAINS